MFHRWRAIYVNVGTSALLRTLFMLVGMIGLSIGGYLFTDSLACASTSVCGIVLGVVFRRPILNLRDHYSEISRVGLMIYGVVLFVGKYSGLSTNATLVVITSTTAAVFNLNFWCFSEPVESMCPAAEQD